MWLAVRSIYLFDQKSDGTNVFEERVVCFQAESVQAALEKGRIECARYAEENGFEAHPTQEGYEQDGDALIDGYEVWSVLLESRESLREFYVNRYDRYDYRPE